MADNFSVNQIQGVLGEFSPILDETVTPTINNFQGVLGQFIIVLDEAAGVVVIGVDEMMAAIEGQGSGISPGAQPLIIPTGVVSY